MKAMVAARRCMWEADYTHVPAWLTTDRSLNDVRATMGWEDEAFPALEWGAVMWKASRRSCEAGQRWVARTSAPHGVQSIGRASTASSDPLARGRGSIRQSG